MPAALPADESPGSVQRPESRHRSRAEVTAILLTVAVAALLCLCRYQDPRRITSSGDSYWYMRQAQIFAGVDAPHASAEAATLLCRDVNRSTRALGGRPYCTLYVTEGISPRYAAIFASRPGYPLFAAAFVAVLGAWWGMVTATMVLALLSAALTYLAVRMATGSRPAGVVAGGCLLLLPSGFWMTRVLAESAVVAGYLGVLIGAMLLWRGRRAGLPIVVVALAWLFAVRSASGTAAALALLGAAAVAVVTGFPARRGPLMTGGLAAAALAAWSAVAATLDLPGLNETIQDYATGHFKKPDIPHPIGWLLRKDVEFWHAQARTVLVSPWSVAAAVFAAVVLVRRLRHLAVLWVSVGLTGVLTVLAHPLRSEYDRLMLPMWIPVAAAFGVAAALAVRRPEDPGRVVPPPGTLS
jgi:hypothetical protein